MRWIVSIGIVMTTLSINLADDIEKAGYSKTSMEGFTVYLHKEIVELVNSRKDAGAIGEFRVLLGEVIKVVPAEQLKILQKTPIWVDWDAKEGRNLKALAVYRTGTAEEWAREGVLPQKVNAINMLSLKDIHGIRRAKIGFGANILLHEFGHAYHHNFLKLDNPHVKAAYQQARDRNLYEKVRDFAQRETGHYALTNEREYFAELSGTYLFQGSYYPFNRKELREYDPQGYALMQYAWGPMSFAQSLLDPKTKVVLRDELTGGDTSNKTERKAKELFSVAMEFFRKGDLQRTREYCKEVVKQYPNTDAAKEAKRFLLTIGEK